MRQEFSLITQLGEEPRAMQITRKDKLLSICRRILIMLGAAGLVGYSAMTHGLEKYEGFWKEKCSQPYGLQFKHYRDGTYNINFCGPGGGCDEPPDPSNATDVENDPQYEVIDEKTIRIIYSEGYAPIYKKCTDNTNPILKYDNARPEREENPYISCAGSSENAIVSIPHSEVRNWAQVICSKYGHLIVPANEYLWSLYGGFAPIVLSAQAIQPKREAKEVGNTVYFTEITVSELNSKESKQIVSRLSFFNTEPDDDKLLVYKLFAKSNTETEYTVYFLDYGTSLRGAMPYPAWFPNENRDELLPFFIFHAKDR